MAAALDDVFAGMSSTKEVHAPAARAPANQPVPLIGDAGSPSKYWRKQLLGRGASGSAYLVENATTKELFVGKEVDLSNMNERSQQYAKSEVQCLGNCDHFAVLKLVDSAEQGSTLVLVTENGDAGDLRMHIRARRKTNTPFAEKDVWQVFTQLCLALDHIHSRKMLHRDIKSANVFLTTMGLVKLGDFGLSAMYDDTVSADVGRSLVGTPCYLPPELYRGQAYSKKADMWSVGVLLYELCTLQRPFGGNTFAEMRDAVLSAVAAPQIPDTYSLELRRTVDSLLQLDANKRMSADEILRKEGLDHVTELLSSVAVTDTIPAATRESVQAQIAEFLERARSPV